MRPEPPRLPLRPAGAVAAAAPTEESRASLPAGDPATRRREDGAARRGASAHRLMGAVARRLLDEDEEERIQDGGSTAAGAAPQGAPAPGTDRQVRSDGRSLAISGRGRRSGSPAQAGSAHADPGATRVGARAARRRAAVDEAVWGSGAAPIDDPPAVSAPAQRIEPTRAARPVAPPRLAAPERVGHTAGLRKLSWGALLAAVAGLVIVLLIGGFDPPGAANGHDGGPGAARDAASPTQPPSALPPTATHDSAPSTP